MWKTDDNKAYVLRHKHENQLPPQLSANTLENYEFRRQLSTCFEEEDVPIVFRRIPSSLLFDMTGKRSLEDDGETTPISESLVPSPLHLNPQKLEKWQREQELGWEQYPQPPQDFQSLKPKPRLHPLAYTPGPPPRFAPTPPEIDAATAHLRRQRSLKDMGTGSHTPKPQNSKANPQLQDATPLSRESSFKKPPLKLRITNPDTFDEQPTEPLKASLPQSPSTPCRNTRAGPPTPPAFVFAPVLPPDMYDDVPKDPVTPAPLAPQKMTALLTDVLGIMNSLMSEQNAIEKEGVILDAMTELVVLLQEQAETLVSMADLVEEYVDEVELADEVGSLEDWVEGLDLGRVGLKGDWGSDEDARDRKWGMVKHERDESLDSGVGMDEDSPSTTSASQAFESAVSVSPSIYSSYAQSRPNTSSLVSGKDTKSYFARGRMEDITSASVMSGALQAQNQKDLNQVGHLVKGDSKTVLAQKSTSGRTPRKVPKNGKGAVRQPRVISFESSARKSGRKVEDSGKDVSRSGSVKSAKSVSNLNGKGKEFRDSALDLGTPRSPRRVNGHDSETKPKWI